jgi:hypothetical protein
VASLSGYPTYRELAISLTINLDILRRKIEVWIRFKRLSLIQIGNFVAEEPEAIWPFVLKWGSHEDEDLRTAIATCLLEHLLEYHFDLLFPRVETAAGSNSRFANMTTQCWKLGQAEEPTRAARFDHLLSEIRKDSTKS